MDAGLIWLGLYFFVLRPLKLLPPPSPESQHKYLRGHGLVPRWPVNKLVSDWRVYENLHILCWLGKDCAWNHYGVYAGDGRMWIVFMIPTLLIAIDFALTSLARPDAILDHTHYAATLMWVFGNMAWAIGEIWGHGYFDVSLTNVVSGPVPMAPAPAPAPGPAPPVAPGPVSPPSPQTVTGTFAYYSVRSGRYWSFWILLSSYLFIAPLYVMWAWAQSRRQLSDRVDGYSVRRPAPPTEKELAPAEGAQAEV